MNSNNPKLLTKETKLNHKDFSALHLVYFRCTFFVISSKKNKFQGKKATKYEFLLATDFDELTISLQ